MNKEIYIYNDEPFNPWGRMVAMAVGRQGVKPILFRKVEEVPAGATTFIRIDQQQGRADIGKIVVYDLLEKGCKVFPGEQEAVWYDDKVEQYEALEPWLPYTKYIGNYEDLVLVKDSFNYPLISKSSSGASSANVRLIRDKAELIKEADNAFIPARLGIPISYNRFQKGYLYLQEYIKASYDYRVLVMGNYIMGKKRFIKSSDKPFASGSGKHEVLNYPDIEVFSLANEICNKLGIQWTALDFVRSESTDKLYVLEISTSWSTTSNLTMPVFNRFNYTKVDGMYKAHMFDILAEILVRGEF